MLSPHETAKKYTDSLAALDFAAAFEMLAPDVQYRVIGKTSVSRSYSKSELLAELVPWMGAFIQPPTLTFHELIVEGDRAVALASGHGVGPTGLPYDQPHYAMVLRIADGAIIDVVEFLDTVEIETQANGRQFLP